MIPATDTSSGFQSSISVFISNPLEFILNYISQNPHKQGKRTKYFFGVFSGFLGFFLKRFEIRRPVSPEMSPYQNNRFPAVVYGTCLLTRQKAAWAAWAGHIVI